jgi:hypothetical protein
VKLKTHHATTTQKVHIQALTGPQPSIHLELKVVVGGVRAQRALILLVRRQVVVRAALV